jgi:hypothetical protein
MWLSILLLSTLLDRAVQSAETFWTQVSAIECTEQVLQARVRKDGKVTARRSSVFDYLLTLKLNGSALMVEESRIPRKSGGKEDQFLLTSGFPTLLLIFHPNFRDRFDFEVYDTENRIAFQLKAGARSLSAVRMSGRSYPIRWRGDAWIDAANGSIQRISASAEPMPEIGIEELKAEVEYGSVALPGQPAPFWMPERATIILRSPRQEWKNVHELGSYRVFSVTSTTRAPEADAP